MASKSGGCNAKRESDTQPAAEAGTRPERGRDACREPFGIPRHHRDAPRPVPNTGNARRGAGCRCRSQESGLPGRSADGGRHAVSGAEGSRSGSAALGLGRLGKRVKYAQGLLLFRRIEPLEQIEHGALPLGECRAAGKKLGGVGEVKRFGKDGELVGAKPAMPALQLADRRRGHMDGVGKLLLREPASLAHFTNPVWVRSRRNMLWPASHTVEKGQTGLIRHGTLCTGSDWKHSPKMLKMD